MIWAEGRYPTDWATGVPQDSERFLRSFKQYILQSEVIKFYLSLIVAVVSYVPCVLGFNISEVFFVRTANQATFPCLPFVSWTYCPHIWKNLDWFVSIVPFINTWQLKSANNRERNYQKQLNNRPNFNFTAKSPIGR